MFRTIGDGSLWESCLPPELLRLPEDLARVDMLLDNLAFFALFAPFSAGAGTGVHAGGVLPAADVLEVPAPARL